MQRVTFYRKIKENTGLKHGQKVKVFVAGKDGSMGDRMPAYIRKVERDDGEGFAGVYWNPDKKFKFKHKGPKTPNNLRIYEAHVGMALEEGRVGTYNEFEHYILPKIDDAGYKTILTYPQKQ